MNEFKALQVILLVLYLFSYIGLVLKFSILKLFSHYRCWRDV